ncbi:hypothetical protein FHS55_000403 [Angulomicrobium tetraedrale]|uniref:Uncharacterized protein n=1 Tax=Ancylobacter tetraedralis TaxID=217068 RepID=A0A839Z8K6_9HYPH|nr:hypothetical protein [Ancylobacter tetraedralis]MBB3769817.1 hypothetical protein [Ancylobacter tetraedralis]
MSALGPGLSPGGWGRRALPRLRHGYVVLRGKAADGTHFPVRARRDGTTLLVLIGKVF